MIVVALEPSLRMSSTVRRTVSHVALIFAWLCANGAIWDVAQVLAWTRMFTSYAQTLPVQQALSATFDPSKPCEICVGVAKAREQERTQAPLALESSGDKLVLALHTPAPIVFRAPPSEWPSIRWTLPPARLEPVPLPPPRA